MGDESGVGVSGGNDGVLMTTLALDLCLTYI